MHPAKGRTAAGGLTCLSLPDNRQKHQDKFAFDSGTADSGFLSGQNLSSDSFTSTPDVQEDPLNAHFLGFSGIPQKTTLLQEEDSQTFDSGVDLDSSHQQQQVRIGDTMRVDNMEELCKIMLQLQVNQREQIQPKTWEKLFHQNEDGDT